MIFETFAAGGCKSYIVGCETTRAAALIDPEISQIDRYVGFAHQHGVHIRYIDRHPHPCGPLLRQPRAWQGAIGAGRHASAEPDAPRRPAAR